MLKKMRTKPDPTQRETYIMFSAIVGISVNIVLILIKLAIGAASNSIAIISDATNNMSDSVSSLVTIIGVKIASKPATKKHPFGYGRVEYMTGVIASILLLLAGIQFFISSGERIIHPEPVSFSVVAIILIFISIFVKIGMGIFNHKMGNKANSFSLKASGTEAYLDAIVSTITLISAIISLVSDITIDGYAGIIISAFIIISGLKLLKETISSMIGERPDIDLANQIKQDVSNYEPILGVYDLILHNYGPVRFIGSLNVEIPMHHNIGDIYVIFHQIEKHILETYNTRLILGIYAVNDQDEFIVTLREKIEVIIAKIDHVLDMHALHVDKTRQVITFHIVVDFKARNELILREMVIENLKREYPNYEIDISIDKQFA